MQYLIEQHSGPEFSLWGVEGGYYSIFIDCSPLLGVQVASILIHIVQSSKQKATCIGKNYLNSSFMSLDPSVEALSGEMSRRSLFYKIVCHKLSSIS